MTIDVTPAEKHGDLKAFEPVKEFAEDVDRLAVRGHAGL
jgi:hypothetical protein